MARRKERRDKRRGWKCVRLQKGVRRESHGGEEGGHIKHTHVVPYNKPSSPLKML